MFSKPFKVEGIISATGTERSDLKERARDLFGIQDSSFDELCGDKNEMCVVKIKTFGEDDVTVYASDNRPIFFEFNGKLIPTVCTLRVCTEMVPYFTTRPEVLSQLAQGADLMITEVVRQGSGLESWGNYSENDIVAVNLTSNQAAIGVGLLAHSSEDLCTGEDCGVCVVMLHVFGDELWEMEQSVCEQVPLLRETQSVRREEDIPILDESERVERINELDLSAAIEQPGDNENNSGNELEQSNQFNYDSLLKSAFLNTIILHRDKIELPIPMCTFYLQYVQPELPAAFEIEHSSYKLIGTFLEKMSEEGLIQIEGEEEDIQTIIAINSNHPNVQSLNGKTDNMNVTKFASVPIELYSCILKGPEIQNIDCQTTSVIEDGEPSTFPTCSKTIDSNLMKKSESDVNMEGFDERVTIDPSTSVKAVPGAKCSKAAAQCTAKEPSNSVAKVSKTQKKYHRKTVTDKGGNASRRFGYKKITSTKIPQESGLNVASVGDDVEQFQATTSTLDMNRKKNTKFPKRGNNLPTTSTSSKNTNDIPERNLQNNGMNVVNFSRTANQSAVNEPSVPRIKNEGWRHRRGVENENITLKRNQPNKGMNEAKLACAVNQGVANKSSTSDGSGTHDGGKRRRRYWNKNITHRENPEFNAVNVANLSRTVNQGPGYEPNINVAKVSSKQKTDSADSNFHKENDNMDVTKFASIPIELNSCVLKGLVIQNIDCQTTSVIEDGEPSTFPTRSIAIDGNLMKHSESAVNMDSFAERVAIEPNTSVKAILEANDVKQFPGATTSTLDMNRKKKTKVPKKSNNLPTTSTSSKNTDDIPKRTLENNGMNVVNFSRTANQSAVNEPSVSRIKNEGWRHRRGVGNKNITLKRNQQNKGMNEAKLTCAVNQGEANNSSTSVGSGTHDGGKRRKGYQNKNITHRRNPENNAVNVANLSSTVNQGAGYEPNTDVAKISGKQKAKNRSALRLQQFINKKCAVTEVLENNGMAVTEYDSAAEQDAANAPSASVENVSRIRENYYQMALLEENTDGNELNASRFARDAQHGAVHSGITEVFKATSAIEENDVPTTATCSKYASFTQRKNPENNALNLINLSKTIHQDAGYEPNTNIAKVSRKQKAKISSTLRLQQFINKKCAVTEESENNGVAVNKYNSVVEQDAANEPSASVDNIDQTASTNEGETGPKNNEKYYQKTSTREDGKYSKRSRNKNVTHRRNIENKDRNAVKFSNTNNQGASKKPSTNAAKVSTNQRIFYKTTATNSTLMKNKGITNVPGTCVANVFRTHKKGSQTTIANHNNHRRNPANNDVNMIRFSRAANRTPGNDANTSVAKKYRTQKKNNQTTSISKCEKGPTLTKKNIFTHRTNSQNNCVDIASIANALQQGTAHEPSTSAANVSGSQKSYWQATSDNNDNDPGTSSMYDELYYLIRDGLGGIEPLVWQRSPRLSETQSGNRAPGPVEEATELELSAGVDQLSDSQNEILKINSENGSEEGDQSYYDKLIKSVFLNVITIYNTRIQLPILFSTFYPKYMQPELSAKFDVKRSSHKKVGVFLNKMAGEGFIRIGEEKKGVQKIVAIHSNHPELRSFTPYDLKNPEPLHPNLLWTEMADMFAVYTVFGPKRVTIHLTIATRYRNKKITLISNLKEYGVNVNKFAKMVRLGAATSTSMKGEQLLVQGNHIKFVYNLLMETYEVPKSCITGLEFANDSEKKNYRRGVVSGLGFIQKRNKNRCRQTRTGYMAGEVREDTPISNSKYYRQTLTKFAAIDDREAAISAGTREKLGSKKSCCRIKSLCKGRKKTVIRSPAATRSEYRKVTLIRNPVNLDVNATNASNYFQRFSAVTISRIVVIRKRNNKGPKPSNNISITIESSKNAGKCFGVHVAISSTFADQGSTVEPSTSVAAITAPNVTTAEQQGRSVRNPSTNNRT